MHRMLAGVCIALIALAGVGAAGAASAAPPEVAQLGQAAVPPPPPPPPPAPPPPQAEQNRQRAEREMAQAQERLASAAGYARTNDDTQILFTMARRYLALAEAHYAAGRYFQAAEVAAAVVRLAEAIRHLAWAQARN